MRALCEQRCDVQDLALKQATAELEQLRQVAGKARAQVEGLEKQLEEKVRAASCNFTAFEGHKASGVCLVRRTQASVPSPTQ